MKLGSCVLLAGILSAVAAGSCVTTDDAAERREESAQCLSAAGDLYEQKIAPLLATDRPKTCNQCHLSGVDLGLFVRDDMCETRACLVELGLVNTERPDESAVLGWIERAHPESELITQAVIDEEYEAFRAFVRQIATCGGQACPGVHCPATHGEDACEYAGEELYEAITVPPETGCDSLSVEQAFKDGVYVWRDRCYPCHFTSEKGAVPGAPLWINTLNDCNSGSLATFHNVLELGLIDTDDPRQSLLLLKPLDQGDIMHGGGAKFSGEDDPSYASFLSFIEYWIGCGAPVP